jgi:hypothetical protein
MVIQSKFITKALSWFIQIQAITLWPFIITASPLREVDLRHEKIHLRQQVELLVVGFYLLYVWDFLVNALWHRMSPAQAYFWVRFEVEAYDRQYEEDYLEARPLWAWRHFKRE